MINAILADIDSRKIFYFMLLVLQVRKKWHSSYLLSVNRINFSFMVVQTIYGVVTGSLGLLSDSVHMFLDCMALAVGLCAAVMSKWPPSVTFPYGLGFANGIFLMYDQIIALCMLYKVVLKSSF